MLNDALDGGRQVLLWTLSLVGFDEVDEVMQLVLLFHCPLGLVLVQVSHCIDGLSQNSDLSVLFVVFLDLLDVSECSKSDVFGVSQSVVLEDYILFDVFNFESSLVPVELFNEMVLVRGDAKHKTLDHFRITVLQNALPVSVPDE